MTKELLKIVYNKKIAKDTFEMKLASKEICKEANCGQFINLALNDQSKLLKRPISICGISEDYLIITYKIKNIRLHISVNRRKNVRRIKRNFSRTIRSYRRTN